MALVASAAASAAAGARGDAGEGWRQPRRVVWAGGSPVVLGGDGALWWPGAPGAWRRLAPGAGERWADLAVDPARGGDRLLLLAEGGTVHEMVPPGPARPLWDAPPGARWLAVSGATAWMAAPAAAGEEVVLWRRELVAPEATAVALEVPLSRDEAEALDRGHRLERVLFNRLVLVPSGDGGVTILFALRDLMARCHGGSCAVVSWRSPRTEALAARPAVAGTPPPPLVRLRDAVALGDGEVAVLPFLTRWEPATGAFDQRDQVVRVDRRGRVLERCPLPGRGVGLVARGGAVWALLESGRLARACAGDAR